jgi:hypothetical protein
VKPVELLIYQDKIYQVAYVRKIIENMQEDIFGNTRRKNYDK